VFVRWGFPGLYFVGIRWFGMGSLTGGDGFQSLDSPELDVSTFGARRASALLSISTCGAPLVPRAPLLPVCHQVMECHDAFIKGARS
jgi:hypothetical protein